VVKTLKRKRCADCKRTRLIKFFNLDAQKKDGFRVYCKDCQRSQGKGYYNENKEAVLKRTNSYKREHKAYYTKYAADYRQENRELLRKKNCAYYLQNREEVIARTHNWAKLNRDKRAVIDHRRRAKKLNQLGKVSSNIEETLWKNQKGKCYYCHTSLVDIGYHQEHKTPIDRGGFHDDSNLCLSCPTCNFRKGRKTEEEFRSLGGGYPRVA
jgi:5-methylcytosine-specific restriction endonuclease McrA